MLEGANRDAEGEGAEIPCAEELSSLLLCTDESVGLGALPAPGRRSKGSRLWPHCSAGILFFKQAWLWQLPLQPWGSGAVLLSLQGPAPRAALCLGTLGHPLLFLLLSPPCTQSAALSCLRAPDAAAWHCLSSPGVFLTFLWIICCNIVLYILFRKSWFSIGSVLVTVVLGLFPALLFRICLVWVFFSHSDSEKCF